MPHGESIIGAWRAESDRIGQALENWEQAGGSIADFARLGSDPLAMCRAVNAAQKISPMGYICHTKDFALRYMPTVNTACIKAIPDTRWATIRETDEFFRYALIHPRLRTRAFYARSQRVIVLGESIVTGSNECAILSTLDQRDDRITLWEERRLVDFKDIHHQVLVVTASVHKPKQLLETEAMPVDCDDEGHQYCKTTRREVGDGWYLETHSSLGYSEFTVLVHENYL